MSWFSTWIPSSLSGKLRKSKEKRRSSGTNTSPPPSKPDKQQAVDASRQYISRQMSTMPSMEVDAQNCDSLLLNMEFITSRQSGGNALHQSQTEKRPELQRLSTRRSAALPPFVRVESLKEPPNAGSMMWTNSRRALEVCIDREEETSRSNKGDTLTQAQRLAERLDRLNLQVHEMKGDGNCQFRSLSHELFGTAEYHQYVRARIVEYIVEHRQDFEVFLGEDFGDYVQAMAQDKCWGDELTLRAASEAYGAIVHVVTSNETHWHHVYRPAKGEFEIFIAYISPVHYNAIRRKPALKAMAATLGNSFKRMSSSRGESNSGGSDISSNDTYR